MDSARTESSKPRRSRHVGPPLVPIAVIATAFLLPLARFGGLAWLIVAAALLPVQRRTSSSSPERNTP